MNTRIFSFLGGTTGEWRVRSISLVTGHPLSPVPRISVRNEYINTLPFGTTWCLRGATSFERYVTTAERQALEARQPAIGRDEATCAALIPIKKSPSWWRLTQEERRTVFEERSSHIGTGLKYLPAIARRLHHGYDLGEPFDFLTWFEYSPTDSDAFDELVATLRATQEWQFVEREIDIRLEREFP
jgi:hypothetical protein